MLLLLILILLLLLQQQHGFYRVVAVVDDAVVVLPLFLLLLPSSPIGPRTPARVVMMIIVVVMIPGQFCIDIMAASVACHPVGRSMSMTTGSPVTDEILPGIGRDMQTAATDVPPDRCPPNGR